VPYQFRLRAQVRLEHFSQYYELSNGCYEQLSLAESCANFCGFDLHLCEKCFSDLVKAFEKTISAQVRFGEPGAPVPFLMVEADGENRGSLGPPGAHGRSGWTEPRTTEAT
jgi:hypothetical protein